jgi:putative membrane protein
MTRFLLRAGAGALGFWIASRFVPGLHVGGVVNLLWAGLVLGLLNAVVRPVLILFTLPLSILTLGLFLFVVNGLTVWLVTWFAPGVRIHSLWPAILTALIISVVSWIVDGVLGDLRERRR